MFRPLGIFAPVRRARDAVRPLYRNWAVHNLVSHPLSAVVFAVLRPFSRDCGARASDAVHNVTIPDDIGGWR